MHRRGSQADYFRIKASFDLLKNRGDLALYKEIRAECESSGRSTKTYASSSNNWVAPPPTFGGVPAASTSGRYLIDYNCNIPVRHADA